MPLGKLCIYRVCYIDLLIYHSGSEFLPVDLGHHLMSFSYFNTALLPLTSFVLLCVPLTPIVTYITF